MGYFEEIVCKSSDQTQLLASQNAKLAQSRELLLPRLMDEEIAV